MPADDRHARVVVALAAELEAGGFEPVLVGGMALALLGSQRITRDFDLLVVDRERSAGRIADIMYQHGLELVTKFSPEGEVLHTVDSRKVATIKLEQQKPRSIPFYHPTTRLRVDLLMDFPLPAHEITDRATKVRVARGHLRIATRDDLIRLKEIARKDRTSATDAQDLEFLHRLPAA